MTGTKFTVCWKLHISFNKHNYQDFDSEPGGTLLRRADFITASQSADLQSNTLRFLHRTRGPVGLRRSERSDLRLTERHRGLFSGS